jgi:nicotinamidase-related amidase
LHHASIGTLNGAGKKDLDRRERIGDNRRSRTAVSIKRSSMPTLEDRPNTAVVVIDVQNAVMADTYNRDGVVKNVSVLVDKARTNDVPVIWVQDTLNADSPPGSEGWQIVPELDPADGEVKVSKDYPDAFEETNLETVLSGLQVGRLVVSGAQTDECIRSTLHGAITRGYDAVLVSDAHTTEDFSEWGAPPADKVIAHTNLYWGSHTAPGRQAGTVTTGSVEF